MYPSHPEPNNTWTKVSHKRGRRTQEDEEAKDNKYVKENEYCPLLTPTATQRYWKRIMTNNRIK
jgi:hypothetical protein